MKRFSFLFKAQSLRLLYEQIDDQNCIYRIYDIDGQLIQEGNSLDVLKKMSHGLFVIQEINNNRTDVYKVSR